MTKHLIGASAIAIMALASTAYAAGGQKLSKAECDSLWMQANPSGAATIDETQAKGYVTDFKAANPDNDGTIDKVEFAKACKSGLVSGTASSGAGTGASGAGSSSQQ
ncbi:hypothetical protein [uncultured Hyphomicrobium sp.]|uniref:hypothetical protein n=1 Tax=uncultured Hyphomicrobium sp. TaxID=194373 RepID=UPI0025FFCE59|nr:hypothetical protein [uncultured Hyphomicrobium sp.]